MPYCYICYYVLAIFVIYLYVTIVLVTVVNNLICCLSFTFIFFAALYCIQLGGDLTSRFQFRPVRPDISSYHLE